MVWVTPQSERAETQPVDEMVQTVLILMFMFIAAGTWTECLTRHELKTATQSQDLSRNPTTLLQIS
jgi:hypothetical protein